jgi:hypothetical protein
MLHALGADEGGQARNVLPILKTPQLDIRTTEKLGKSRAKVSREEVAEQFNNLGREFDENQFLPDNIYNVDETDLDTEGKKLRAIAQTGTKQV